MEQQAEAWFQCRPDDLVVMLQHFEFRLAPRDGVKLVSFFASGGSTRTGQYWTDIDLGMRRIRFTTGPLEPNSAPLFYGEMVLQEAAERTLIQVWAPTDLWPVLQPGWKAVCDALRRVGKLGTGTLASTGQTATAASRTQLEDRDQANASWLKRVRQLEQKPLKGGRRRHPENAWAYEQVHVLGREPNDVYKEWLQKVGNDKLKTLDDPRDSFQKAIKPKK